MLSKHIWSDIWYWSTIIDTSHCQVLNLPFQCQYSFINQISKEANQINHLKVEQDQPQNGKSNYWQHIWITSGRMLVENVRQISNNVTKIIKYVKSFHFHNRDVAMDFSGTLNSGNGLCIFLSNKFLCISILMQCAIVLVRIKLKFKPFKGIIIFGCDYFWWTIAPYCNRYGIIDIRLRMSLIYFRVIVAPFFLYR